MKKHIVMAVMAVAIVVVPVVSAQAAIRPAKNQVFASLMQFVKNNLNQASTTPTFDGASDLNNDGRVNALDLGILKQASNATTSSAKTDVIATKMLGAVHTRIFAQPGDMDYSSALDVNRDQTINALDLGIVKSVFPISTSTSATSTPSNDEVVGKLFAIVRSKLNSNTTTPRFNENIDFDSNGKVNALDLGLLRRATLVSTSTTESAMVLGKLVKAFMAAENTTAALYDLNDDERVNALDLGLMRRAFPQIPATTTSTTETQNQTSTDNTNTSGNTSTGTNTTTPTETTPARPTNEQIFTKLFELMRSRQNKVEGDEIFDHDFDFDDNGKINALDLGMLKRATLATTSNEQSTDVYVEILKGIQARQNTSTGDGLFLHYLDFNDDQKINALDLAAHRAAFDAVAGE